MPRCAAAILVCGGAGAEGKTGPVACEYRDRPRPERGGNGSERCASGPPVAALTPAGGGGLERAAPPGTRALLWAGRSGQGLPGFVSLLPAPPRPAPLPPCRGRAAPPRSLYRVSRRAGAEQCPGKGKSPLAGTNEKRRCCSAAVAMDKIKQCLFLAWQTNLSGQWAVSPWLSIHSVLNKSP